jgi:alpha-tubulin suppressor-like RCC1 family protein
VLSAGWNGQGQLGDGSVTAHGWELVPGLTGVRAVSAGGMHSLALTDDGRLRVWGWNGYGQLGTGTTVEARTPSAANGLTSVAGISAGWLHSAAVRG